MAQVSTEKYFKNKQILITGGSGFIGSNLAHALVALGAKITILDAMLPLYGGNAFNFEDIREKVTFVEGDIRDKELMADLVKKKDVVYNLAGQISYIDSKDKPILDLEMNALGYLNILESIHTHSPQAKVVFASSRLVYGPILTTPVREDHPTNPLSLYGIHKLVGEKYSRYYSKTFGIDTVSIRIPNPYGPRQQMKHNKYSIVGWFVRQALEDKEITIFGEGTQERDYLYIDDIVAAFLALTVKGVSGEVYNIGNDERIRFIDMIDTIIKQSGSGHKKFVPWPAEYEKNETGNYIADTSKIHELTGWKPKVSLDEGVHRMLEYYKKFKKHYW